jgi:hypothetical protein
MKIQYLNTDLDLHSPTDIRALTRELSRNGMFVLHEEKDKRTGVWFACLETEMQFRAPNANILAMVKIIKRLSAKAQAVWSGCTLREINIGYECGDTPRFFHQCVTNITLRRMTAVGATLRITLYAPIGTPDRP